MHRLNSVKTLIEKSQGGSSEAICNYIRLDAHKKTISYCMKDASGRVQREGKVGSKAGLCAIGICW